MVSSSAPPDNAPITDMKDLRRWAGKAVGDYMAAPARAAGCLVVCRFYATDESLRRGDPRNHPGAISPVREGSRLTLHLSLAGLSGISPLALRGWLNLILQEAELDQQLGPERFNFKRQILPLFPVSGSAVLFLRDLVEQLDRALLRYLAAEELLRLGRIESMTAYCRYDLRVNEARDSHYLEAIPHDWVRALFLCRKAQSYAAVYLLERIGVDSAQGLRADWEGVNRYVAEDRILLEQLMAVPALRAEFPYGQRLVAMFGLVSERLLLRRQSQEAASQVH